MSFHIFDPPYNVSYLSVERATSSARSAKETQLSKCARCAEYHSPTTSRPETGEEKDLDDPKTQTPNPSRQLEELARALQEEDEGGRSSSPSAPPLTPHLTTLTSSPPIPASVFTVTTSVDIEVGSTTATAPVDEEHEVVTFDLLSKIDWRFCASEL